LKSPLDLSYLADTVVLMRYFEAFGEVRKAISLMKRRTGAHGSSVRELHISDEGMRVGREIRDFQGVLTGRLQYMGDAGPLMRRGNGRETANIGENIGENIGKNGGEMEEEVTGA
jgi:circadian clock protein KaiC